MKRNIITKLFYFPLLVLFFSCEFEYENAIDTDNIDSDIYIETSGFISVNTVINYDEIEYQVRLKRKVGVSKKLVLGLDTNSQLIDEYNLTVENDYGQLENAYYSIPDSVVFNANSKETSFIIKMYPKALYSKAGSGLANNFILPLEISSVLEGNAMIELAKCRVLVNLKMEEPSVKVKMPSEPVTLNFVKGVNISQEYSLIAETNFTTLDVAKTSVETRQEWVDAYNQASGTNYQLLPANTYEIVRKTFETDSLNIALRFSCSDLNPDNKYLLPLMMKQEANYNIVQFSPVYIIVEVSEIRLSITNAGEVIDNFTVTETATGTIRVKLKSSILDDIPVRFIYDQELIASYNAANGTSFLAYPSQLLDVEETKIAAGTQFVNVGYSLKTTGMPIDPANEYLIPLVIDKTQLPDNSVLEGDSVIYLKLVKTIEGQYNIEGNEGIHYAGRIKPGRDKSRGDWMLEAWDGYNFDWASYFIITNGNVNGDKDLVKIQFNDVIGIFYKKDEGTVDRITVDNSYINLKTGEIYFYVEWLNSDGNWEFYKGLYYNQKPI